ncbi:MAG: maleylpyruvate isomerase family mycothiol-dependent enzyme [Acidimicrobiia bacterium]|jgi:uncharacterized protein (TIGR03083 family)
MRDLDYLTAIRRESEALLAAAAHGLEPAVPSCPGWTVRDVVAHTGVVHRHKEQIVREHWIDGSPERVEPPAEGLLEWFRHGVDHLIRTLASHDPSEPISTFHPPNQTVGFWYRRMAHETAIHRVDAELGHHPAGRVERRLASDGIDELLEVMLPGVPERATAVATGVVLGLECTDTDGRWTLREVACSGAAPEEEEDVDDIPAFVFDEADPTTVMRGTASDLLLYGWGRGPVDRLQVEGDDRIVAVFREVAARGT